MPYEIKGPITTLAGLRKVFEECDSPAQAIEAIEQASAESIVEFDHEMAEVMRTRIAESGTSIEHTTIDALLMSLDPPPTPSKSNRAKLPPTPPERTVEDVAALANSPSRPPEVSDFIERAMALREADTDTGGFGCNITELELLLTQPENFLLGLALDYGTEACDEAYQNMINSHKHTTSCGDVSSFLFRTLTDADSATHTKYTSADDPAGGSIKVITDELRKDGDQILRVSLGPHSFIVEKRGSFNEGSCRVFQAYDSGGGQGGYSFATAFERDIPIDTPSFLAHMEAIMYSPYPDRDPRWADFRNATQTIFHGTVDPLRVPASYDLRKCIEVDVPQTVKSLEDALRSFNKLAETRAREFHDFRSNKAQIDVQTYHQLRWPKSWGL